MSVRILIHHDDGITEIVHPDSIKVEELTIDDCSCGLPRELVTEQNEDGSGTGKFVCADGHEQ